MANRSSILARSKQVEAEFVRFLWPDHSADESGSVRDWKDRHDFSGPDYNGNPIFGEAKSGGWVTGPRSLWTLLHLAYQQLEDALAAQGLKGQMVVGYKPLYSNIKDAVCLTMVSGLLTVMDAQTFKDAFVEGKRSNQDENSP